MCEEATAIITLAGEAVALLAMAVPLLAQQSKIKRGQLCQLRSEMLRTYYRHHETCKIRQYEYENFVLLYEAYKALKGNSFIDKIYEEVTSWDVVA